MGAILSVYEFNFSLCREYQMCVCVCVCVNKAHEFQSCFKVSLNTHITYVTYVYKYLQIKLQLKTIIHWYIDFNKNQR